MNRFEQAVYDCMIPTAELLEETTKPLHRAMLLNFWRHVHLEGAGDYDKILAPDMMVDEPVYRVTWGANPAVIRGKDAVLAFYNSVGESVLWHSDDRLAVGDWGVCDEITFHQLARGADLQAVGYEVDDAAALYHVSAGKRSSGRTTSQARLAGEHLYEDKTSLDHRRSQSRRGHHSVASSRDPPGTAREARSRSRRALLGLVVVSPTSRDRRACRGFS